MKRKLKLRVCDKCTVSVLVSFLWTFLSFSHLSMIADAVEVVPSVQRGGVAELPEGLPQIVGAVVFQGTGLLLLKQLVFALHL